MFRKFNASLSDLSLCGVKLELFGKRPRVKEEKHTASEGKPLMESALKQNARALPPASSQRLFTLTLSSHETFAWKGNVLVSDKALELELRRDAHKLENPDKIKIYKDSSWVNEHFTWKGETMEYQGRKIYILTSEKNKNAYKFLTPAEFQTYLSKLAIRSNIGLVRHF